MTHAAPSQPVAVIALVAALAGCSRGEAPSPPVGGGPRSPALEVTGAFLFAPITDSQAGGYFVLHNRGQAADTLLEVSADWADQAMVHETREDAGRVRMRHLEVLVVPPADSVVLRPGGIHVMLMGLGRLPVAGDTVAWTLRMASGTLLAVRAPVVPYGQEP